MKGVVLFFFMRLICGSESDGVESVFVARARICQKRAGHVFGIRLRYASSCGRDVVFIILILSEKCIQF